MQSPESRKNLWFWEIIFFKNTTKALENLSSTEKGKSHLKKHLKEIHFTFDESTAPHTFFFYKDGVNFLEPGVLEINYRPNDNVASAEAFCYTEWIQGSLSRDPSPLRSWCSRSGAGAKKVREAQAMHTARSCGSHIPKIKLKPKAPQLSVPPPPPVHLPVPPPPPST
mmetsp:Transcript_32576/g.45426  ORF Transcript_32576/g.45426 Transcript_32576/m.45426 type:complete len:168 (+) Transcript_32576:1-504(+)